MIKEGMLRWMPEEKAPISAGKLVAGKYRVERVIGSGGMGVVVAATQLELDRPVAIKFMTADAARTPEIVARFSREARAAAKIQGEHVARVLDVGTLESGLPYMVMEYLDGADLSQRMQQAGRLPLAEITGYVLEACEALAEAHAAGIVHRDLKPANLFLARRPDRTTLVKLLDFGISKTPADGGGITSTQAVMGSPVYMSPEQLVSAKSVDARSDIWSLGVVLYEALVGTAPFNAESMPQIVTRILHTPAPRLAESRPDLPPAVDAIVARCLDKDPAGRFGDVAELAWALAPFAEDSARSVERIGRVLNRPRSAPPPPLAPPMPPPLAPSMRPEPAAWGNTQAQIPRHKSAAAAAWVVGITLGICALVGVGAVLVRVIHPALPPAPAATVGVAVPAATSAEPPPVKLAPPADPTATAPTSTPAAEAPTHGRTIRGRLPVAANIAPSAAVSAPPPATTAAPTATEPPDPLHMGIK